MNESKKFSKKWLLLLIPIALVAVLVTVMLIFSPKGEKGSKTITISVVDSAKQTVTYTTKTDAEFLRQAMEETDGLTFSGDESEYGLMVIVVNGETADFNVDGSYWAFYINDEYCNYGIDSQPVADGDSFKIEYTK
ncbi:MAG: DUF4430 domain-containing protein [Oscillospiraceae bacterium]